MLCAVQNSEMLCSARAVFNLSFDIGKTILAPSGLGQGYLSDGLRIVGSERVRVAFFYPGLSDVSLRRADKYNIGCRGPLFNLGGHAEIENLAPMHVVCLLGVLFKNPSKITLKPRSRV